MTHPRQNISSRRPWLLVIKILAWSVMAVALFIFGVLASTVRILTPQRLTPIVETVADRMLNADVNVSRVELSLRSSLPFLNLDINSLSIVATDITSLPDAVRDSLPQWSDTLLAVEKIHGGINLASLMHGRIALNDIEISAPRINILVVNDTLNNFTLMKEPSADDSTDTEIPDISISRFHITHPQPIRFADIASDTHLTVNLTEANLESTPDAYRVSFASNIQSPLFDIFGLDRLPIAFNGNLEWTHTKPYCLKFENFSYAISLLSGSLDTEIDFTDRLTVNSLSLTLNPVAISQVLDMIPPPIALRLAIPQDISTDASIAMDAQLLEPFVAGTSLIPHASVNISIPESYLKWQQLDLRRMVADINIETHGGNLDRAIVNINEFLIAGPATTVQINGSLTQMMNDPAFDGTVKADIDLRRLPAVLLRHVDASMRGHLRALTRIKARSSMFSRRNFHRLKINGDVDLSDFFFLKNDTSLMLDSPHAHFRFSTDGSFVAASDKRIDSLLTAKITVDSASILASDISMHLSHMTLGAGSLNSASAADTTIVIPIGGRLRLKSFSMFSLTDTAGFRLRDLDGNVALRRFKSDARKPVYSGRLNVGRLSAGDNSSRFLISEANINISAFELDDSPVKRLHKTLKPIADSIAAINPSLPVDSVYILALRQHRANHPPTGHRRVHATTDSSDVEVIDWGTTRGLRRLLLGWDIRGSISADRAGMFSTAFPIRNRMRHLDLKFCTDTVTLTNVLYKAGQSDFTMSGRIINIKRALTARRRHSPLKAHFDVISDTININELAAAFFAGAAAAQTTAIPGFDADDLTTDNLDRQLQQLQDTQQPDSAGPLLMPTNLDAELCIKAKNVLYSDLPLRNLNGTALIFDGALNLHNLSASSDVGSVDISALYSAPSLRQMHFGFGLKLNRFNIGHFLRLVPAVDSLMPMMRDFEGIITANIAATSDVDKNMNLDHNSLKAAIRLDGDSLVVIDPETFKTMAKWLMFKNKNKNMINHLSAEMVVEDNELRLFPFIFDFDRYRLGVQGYNDLAMNFDYHVAVLKSPLPFKFGINIKGNTDDYKIRVGRARFNEKSSGQRIAIADTARVNLLRQFENIFRRGVRNSRFATLRFANRPEAAQIDLDADTISAADSLYLIREGLIPAAN